MDMQKNSIAVTEVFPLSTLQEAMLFQCLLSQHTDAYLFSTLLEFESPARLVHWIEALNKVIERHDILRTSIRWEGLPRPVQVVVRTAAMSVQELRLDEGQDPIEYLKQRMRPGHRPTIDLQQAPLARLVIVRGVHGREYGLLELHHLISDWESVKILIDESLHYMEHREADLPPLQAYKEYVAYAVAHAGADRAEAFFKSMLGEIQAPTIPFGVFGPRGEGVEIEEASQPIGPSVAREIRVQAQRYEVTPASLFHAAGALVVACASGQDDVVLGTVLSVLQSKSALEIPRTMGLLVNTLPLRAKIMDSTVSELLKQTHHGLSELLEYVHAPLPVAQRCTRIPGNAPPFTAIIDCRHGRHESERRSPAGVRVLARSEATTGYPICVRIDDDGNEFLITAQTDSRIAATRVVHYVETAIHSLVRALAEAPHTRALSLPILAEAERHHVIASPTANGKLDRKALRATEHVAALVRDVRSKGVLLSVKNGRLHCQVPKDALTSGDIEALQASKDAIIALLERSTAVEVSQNPVARARNEQIPLSLSQAPFWSPNRTFLRATTFVKRVRGELNLKLFRTSLQDLIQRHEALRTRIVVVSGVPTQQVCDFLEHGLQEEDLTPIPDDLLDDAISKQIAQCVLQPIDPSKDPLFLFRLLKIRPADHVLIVATEHLISDGISLQILWRDLLALYAQKVTGGGSELPRIPVQFPDYAVWQIKAHRQWSEQHGAAWADRFKDCRPARFPMQAIPSTTHRRGWGLAHIKIEGPLKTEWQAWCRKRRTTLPLSVLGVYAALLSRWCAVPEVVIPYLTNGRRSPDVENTVGFFASAVYIKVRLHESDSLADVMKHVIADYWQSYEIREFCHLGAELPRPELSTLPSFNWIPKLQDSQPLLPAAGSISSEPVVFENPFFEAVEADSDPALVLQEVGDEVHGSLAFPNRCFSKEMMERFLDNLLKFLKRMLTEPEIRVSDIPLN